MCLWQTHFFSFCLYLLFFTILINFVPGNMENKHVKILHLKTTLLKQFGPRIWLDLFMFRPIMLKQLNCSTTIDTFSWLGGPKVTLWEVPGLIFYDWALVLHLTLQFSPQPCSVWDRQFWEVFHKVTMIVSQTHEPFNIFGTFMASPVLSVCLFKTCAHFP